MPINEPPHGQWTSSYTWIGDGTSAPQPQPPYWHQPPPFAPGVPSVGTNPFESLEPDPCMEEHVIGEITQYPDGVWGNCVECNERIKLPTVPGGYTALQIRGFLERVLSVGEDHDGELLAELGSLINVLEMEKDELDLALKRLDIAKTVLLERSSS